MKIWEDRTTSVDIQWKDFRSSYRVHEKLSEFKVSPEKGLVYKELLFLWILIFEIETAHLKTVQNTSNTEQVVEISYKLSFEWFDNL